MPKTEPLPCPQKEDCPIPHSPACTADQFAACGMVNSVEYITALLGRPRYVNMTTREKSLFLTEHFNVFIDPDEIPAPTSQLVAIIRARIDITRDNSSAR